MFLAERLLKEPHAGAPLKGLPKRYVMMSTSKGAIDAFRRVSGQTRHWADTPGWTVVVLAVGLAIRLAALTWLAPQPLTDDAVDYHALALALISGEGFEADWPPGLPLSLAPFYWILGAKIWVARAVMVGWWLAFCALLFLLTRAAGGRRAANFSLALFAAYPVFVLFSVAPLTPLPMAASLLAVLWSALACTRAAPGRPTAMAGLLLGAALGYAVLIRPSSVTVMFGVPAIIYLRRRRLAASALAVALALAIVGAWVGYAHKVTGRLVLVSDANARNLYYGNSPWTPLYRTWWFGSHKFPEGGVPEAFARELERINQLPPKERDATFVSGVLAQIRARPDLFILRSLARVRTFFAFDSNTASFLRRQTRARTPTILAVLVCDAVHFGAIVMLAIALLLSRWRGEHGLLGSHGDLVVLALGISLLYALPYWLSFAHPNYHVPVVAVLGVLAGLSLSRTDRPNRLPLIVVGLLLLLIQLEWALDMSGRL